MYNLMNTQRDSLISKLYKKKTYQDVYQETEKLQVVLSFTPIS